MKDGYAREQRMKDGYARERRMKDGMLESEGPRMVC